MGSQNDKKILFQPGLNFSFLDKRKVEIKGLMWRFLNDDVPVIHLLGIQKIVKKYNLDNNNADNMFLDEKSQRVFSFIGFIFISFLLVLAATVYKKRDKENNL